MAAEARSKIFLGIDADDTLWHWERVFIEAYVTFEVYVSAAQVGVDSDAIRRLVAQERANIHRYGCGINAFLLSLVEVALHMKLSGPVLSAILADVGGMLYRESLKPELVDGVEEMLDAVGSYGPVLITRGDGHEQYRKLRGSSLASVRRNLRG